MWRGKCENRRQLKQNWRIAAAWYLIRAAFLLEEAESPEMLRGRNRRRNATGEENYESP